MLLISDIFNHESLNIFVDASIVKLERETIGCPGCAVVTTDMRGNRILAEYSDFITRDTTNNRSEIKAIRLGISRAIQYQGMFKHINLFSDSNICVQSITDWIFNWVKRMSGDVLYGSSNEPVINQDIIIDIVNTILNYQLNINIFHQKGHVTRTSDSLSNAREVFAMTNKLCQKDLIKKTDMDEVVDMSLIKAISDYNNFVDVTTKGTLDKLQQHYVPMVKTSNPVSFSINGFDRLTYKSLIRRDV